MVINEGSRHDMFNGLEEVMGKERATVLMEHLPPVGWADVATKRDLDQLKNELKNELLATFRAELLNQTRTMVIAMSTWLVAVAGLAFAAARLV